MAYLTENQLAKVGFASIGKNVLISDKTSIYHPERISIGDRVRIDDFCIITGSVSLGNNIYISVYSYIFGGSNGVVMEDFSGLAYGVRVFTDSDDYSGASLTNPTIPERYKPRKTSKSILIKRHAIVGTSAVIMPGVTLGEGCAVGAMSMVTRSTEPWSICSGVPARRLKGRKKDLLELEKAYLESIAIGQNGK